MKENPPALPADPDLGGKSRNTKSTRGRGAPGRTEPREFQGMVPLDPEMKVPMILLSQHVEVVVTQAHSTNTDP